MPNNLKLNLDQLKIESFETSKKNENPDKMKGGVSGPWWTCPYPCSENCYSRYDRCDF